MNEYERGWAWNRIILVLVVLVVLVFSAYHFLWSDDVGPVDRGLIQFPNNLDEFVFREVKDISADIGGPFSESKCAHMAYYQLNRNGSKVAYLNSLLIIFETHDDAEKYFGEYVSIYDNAHNSTYTSYSKFYLGDCRAFSILNGWNKSILDRSEIIILDEDRIICLINPSTNKQYSLDEGRLKSLSLELREYFKGYGAGCVT